MSIEAVRGKYLGFCIDGTFRHRCVCPECGAKFTSSSPELSAPAICHNCCTGNQVVEEVKRRRGRLKARRRAATRKGKK